VKLEQSQTLLRKQKPIGEVSAWLGFNDRSAFARTFKKWRERRPRRWRAEHASFPTPIAAAPPDRT